MDRRAGFATLGCKVAQYETEAITESFEAAGFSAAPFDSPCDVYVINTCTVTAESDRKSRQMVRRALRANPGAVVMVIGCSSQSRPSAYAAIPGVSYVGGTDGKAKLPAIALDILAKREAERVNTEQTPAQNTPLIGVTPLDGAGYEPLRVRRAPRTRAYVKIEDGCDGRCSYCAIPAARGPVRSRDAESVCAEVADLCAGGTREVVLTGIEIASWGRDLDTGEGLSDLLRLLDARFSSLRFRLSSLTPEALTPAFISTIGGLSTLVPHFHLSLQSGCDEVLRAMRRRYNTHMVKEAVAALRRVMPRVCFTADVMTAFPGETDEMFGQTVSLLESVGFLDLHVFIYSPRAGTPAAALPGRIDAQTAHRRSQTLIALAGRMRDRVFDETIRAAEPVPVLFETRRDGGWFGHSDNYLPVFVPSREDLHAGIRLVLPLSRDGEILRGRLL
ncbi:MAG: tRNA (N(6)-L-threonylcarbamoyladenosine(37)-C(2))-methylthiotransferase MtaB [Clostridia bacterium]|nr:tRNA (N(6)-L-threonylcarbamoyladenosine(37)-C(2))-methylthiotransferase MtaB [Clostridia bacterium]